VPALNASRASNTSNPIPGRLLPAAPHLAFGKLAKGNPKRCSDCFADKLIPVIHPCHKNCQIVSIIVKSKALLLIVNVRSWRQNQYGVHMTFVSRFLRETAWLVVPLSMAGLLVACGGGGGSDNSSSTTTTTKTATLTGEQEVPPVSSGAIGSGTLSLNRASGALSGSVKLDGVTATVAHIHEGAVGANGGVVVALTETTPGTWSVPSGTILTASQIASFDAGRLYFNAHSATNGTGEIRGQIGREVYFASLNGKQEVPPKTTTATGTGVVVFDPDTKSLNGNVALTGITATIAHIHSGAVGTNGSVALSMAETSAGSGIWALASTTVLTDAQIASLRAGELYINAHSATFTTGEIRGQLNRKVAFATLNGAQEVGPTNSTATATGFLSVDPGTRGVTGSVTVTGTTPSVVHVHQGAAGSNGGVQITLEASAGGTTTWVVPANTKLTAAQYNSYLHGELYFNVHSATFTAGEIRGQIEGDGHGH
jgi:hypothetical protein